MPAGIAWQDVRHPNPKSGGSFLQIAGTSLAARLHPQIHPFGRETSLSRKLRYCSQRLSMALDIARSAPGRLVSPFFGGVRTFRHHRLKLGSSSPLRNPPGSVSRSSLSGTLIKLDDRATGICRRTQRISKGGRRSRTPTLDPPRRLARRGRVLTLRQFARHSMNAFKNLLARVEVLEARESAHSLFHFRIHGGPPASLSRFL